MKDKELTPIQELVLRVVKIAQDLGLKGLTKEQILQSVETLQPLIAQERRKAKIEELENFRAFVPYNPATLDQLNYRIAELKEDKEA